MKDIPIIKCPVCGRNMLPSEVFLPNSFFGKQSDITRNNSGEIEFYLGDDMDLDEEYVCDSCLSKLKIHANLSFDVEVAAEENYDEDYITPINKPKKIKLAETELFVD